MTIKVDLQGAHIHEGEAPIAIGGVEWLEWLRGNPKSFRFECSSDTCIEGTTFIKVKTASFTAVRAGKYWQAHKKAQGTLRREHLGLDEKLTYDLMREVACKISSERYWEQRRAEQKSKAESHEPIHHETVAELTSQVTEEIANLKVELERVTQDRDNLLIRLGNQKIQAHEDAKIRIDQLERRVTELDNANLELQKQYTVVDELAKQRGRQLHGLRAELENLKSQPPVSDLIKQYETDYETIKPSLPKPTVTRDWVHFWRFKTWLESRRQNP